MWNDACMDKPVFLDDLPADARRYRKSEFRLALEAHPGQWAVYPGKTSSAYRVAQQMCTNGQVFECKQRGGVAYMRCVKA
jgi:hypothetical protein